MGIYKGENKAVLYKGDYRPAELYKGGQKIAGYNVITKTGKEIDQDDTYNDGLNLKVQGTSIQKSLYWQANGESYQDTTEGKNLIDIYDFKSGAHFDVENNWIHFYTDNSQGSQILYRTCYLLIPADLLENESYTVKIELKENNSTASAILEIGSFGNAVCGIPEKDRSFIITKSATVVQKDIIAQAVPTEREKVYQIVANASPGAIIDYKARLSIVKTEYKDDPYEPFTGGQPSPNPDYPQDITPRIPAGTYKITRPDGTLREFTLDKACYDLKDASGNVMAQDRIIYDVIADVAWVIRESENVTFDGSADELWVSFENKPPNNVKCGTTVLSGKCKNAGGVNLNILCNKLMAQNDEANFEGIRFFNHNTNTTEIRVFIRKTRLATQDRTGFSQWLSQNPIQVLYQLATPIKEPITLTAVETSDKPEVLWTDFGNGSKSPPESLTLSPDYPQPIYNTKNVGLVSMGSNLLPNTFGNVSKNGITVVVNADKSITLNGTCTTAFGIESYPTPFKVESGSYILSTGNSINFGDTAFAVRRYSDRTTIVNISKGNNSKTFTVAENFLAYLILWIDAGTTFNNLTIYPMLTKGTTPYPYQPHKQYTATIPDELCAIPINENYIEGGGNYTDKDGKQWIADYIDFEHGKYVQRIGKQKIILRKEEYPGKPLGYRYVADINGAGRDVAECMSDKFIYNKDAGNYIQTTDGIRVSTRYGTIIAQYTDTAGNVDSIETELHYILKEPIETDITDTELGQQLLAMCTIPDYTRIYADCDDVDLAPVLTNDFKVIDREV